MFGKSDKNTWRGAYVGQECQVLYVVTLLTHVSMP